MAPAAATGAIVLSTSARLADVPALAASILEGKVRGRVVVDVNA